ncbi:MAG: hypothetical protein B9S32_15440 [Verrucomicrobia bacterium Tous-C9LFEB]|nr:MAG: hypothetical protein B9S32_15440 [Verrucomicrobia bacterium Tous-C9LFEB]
MAEIQKQDPATAGEMTQRFVQFIIMQAQQILFVLGNPTPEGDSMPPNLEGGRMLIDQLEMIQEKTKGNLNVQEAKIMEEALSRVRLAFVQASGGTPVSMMPRQSHPAYTPDIPEDEPVPQPEPPRAAAQPAAPAPAPAAPAATPAPAEPENKKKFTKTYG